MIKLIIARSLNGIIGDKEGLPWKLSTDLKRFKRLTTGNMVVMGRKTKESLPIYPLPDRINIVMSRGDMYTNSVEGIIGVYDVLSSLNQTDTLRVNDLWVIGGAEIFNLWWPYVEEVHDTLVGAHIYGDTYFDINSRMETGWEKIEEEYVPEDSNNSHSSIYTVWRKEDEHT